MSETVDTLAAALIAIRLRIAALAAEQRAMDHEARVGTVGERRVAAIEAETRRLAGVMATHADADVIAAAAAL